MFRTQSIAFATKEWKDVPQGTPGAKAHDDFMTFVDKSPAYPEIDSSAACSAVP
jgi:hypothetical protein